MGERDGLSEERVEVDELGERGPKALLIVFVGSQEAVECRLQVAKQLGVRRRLLVAGEEDVGGSVAFGIYFQTPPPS
jgi:hypothetical protein